MCGRQADEARMGVRMSEDNRVDGYERRHESVGKVVTWSPMRKKRELSSTA